EQSGKNQKNEYADVRVWRTLQHEIVNPEGNHRDCRARRHNHANQADDVLAQEVEEPCPISNRILRTHEVDAPTSPALCVSKRAITKKSPSAGSAGPSDLLIFRVPAVAGSPALLLTQT